MDGDPLPASRPSSAAPPPSGPGGALSKDVSVAVRGGTIRGDLALPPAALGTVVFAHGSGSGRSSPRNRWVASELQKAGIATLLVDLLTPEEEAVDVQTLRYRFDIPRLADRLVEVIDRLARWPETETGPVGLYGASTGGAAALIAAAARPGPVRALVLRGARSDLAGEVVERVRAPTLFLVGERDPEIRALNEASLARLAGAKELSVVRGATHLFEEPGALQEVARRTREWFLRYLVPDARRRSGLP